MSTAITIEQFQDVAEPTVVDLRAPHEFDAGHIPGSLRLEPGELATWDPRPGHDVVLVCAERTGCDVAAEVLAARGIGAVVLEGGLGAYLRAGLPVEPDARVVE